MQIFNDIHEALSAGRQTTSVTLIQSPDQFTTFVGQMMYADDEIKGEIINAEFTKVVASYLKNNVFTEPQIFQIDYYGEHTLFYDIWTNNPKAIIFGGGHISVVLAEFMALINFDVTVIDDRLEFANMARFPRAKNVICQDFKRSVQDIVIDDQTAVIIVTRGHRYDLECLRSVINSPAKYLGMIGSRRRVAGIIDMLVEEGYQSNTLSRLHSPIGIDIGASTPAEIALSIAAEVVAIFKKGHLKPLSYARTIK